MSLLQYQVKWIFVLAMNWLPHDSYLQYGISIVSYVLLLFQ